MPSRSFYLFAMPSFLSGVARLADPFRCLDESNAVGNDVYDDALALASDFAAVREELDCAGAFADRP